MGKMELSTSVINEKEAKERAIVFLQQHFIIHRIENIVLEKEVWIVEVSVSEQDNRIFEISIDAKTGHILGYH